MELQTYLLKFQTPKPKKTEAQELATEIYEWSGKKIPFGQLLGFIKLNGTRCVRECFIEAQKSDAKEPIGLFIHKVKSNKTVWQ